MAKPTKGKNQAKGRRRGPPWTDVNSEEASQRDEGEQSPPGEAPEDVAKGPGESKAKMDAKQRAIATRDRVVATLRRLGQRLEPTLDNRQPRGRWVRRITRVSVGLGALILALIIYVVLIRTAPRREPQQGAGQPSQVPVFAVEPVTISRPWRGMGTVQAERMTTVPARVTATVKRIMKGVDEGARVARGGVLAKLDESNFVEEVNAAKEKVDELQAQLSEINTTEKHLKERSDIEKEMVQVAQDDLNRLRNIYQDRAGTRQDVDTARTGLLDAKRSLSATQEKLDTLPDRRDQLKARINGQKARLDLAELDRSRTYIASPMEGVIENLAVDEGENLRSGDPIATIVDLRKLEAQLNLPAAARSGISLGAPITLHSAANPGQTWDANVSRLQPTNDPQSRTMRVYATINQPKAQEQFGQGGADLLTPGTFVTASVQSEQKMRRWVVPRRSVRNGRLYVVRDGVVNSLAVNVDFSLQREFQQFDVEADQWVVLKGDPSATGGLEPDDQVLVNVATSVREGQRVDPVASENSN